MQTVGFIAGCEESNFKRNRFTPTCGIHVYFLDFRISSFIHYFFASYFSVRDVLRYSSFSSSFFVCLFHHGSSLQLPYQWINPVPKHEVMKACTKAPRILDLGTKLQSSVWRSYRSGYGRIKHYASIIHGSLGRPKGHLYCNIFKYEGLELSKISSNGEDFSETWHSAVIIFWGIFCMCFRIRHDSSGKDHITGCRR